ILPTKLLQLLRWLSLLSNVLLHWAAVLLQRPPISQVSALLLPLLKRMGWCEAQRAGLEQVQASFLFSPGALRLRFTLGGAGERNSAKLPRTGFAERRMRYRIGG